MMNLRTISEKSNRELMYQSLESSETYSTLIKESIGWAALYDNKVIGMIYFVPSGEKRRLVENEDWSIIRFLAILPSYRGNGIAKKLIQLCIDEAKKREEKYIFLYTADFMKPAQNAYESFGFKFYDETQNLGRKYLRYLLRL